MARSSNSAVTRANS